MSNCFEHNKMNKLINEQKFILPNHSFCFELDKK